MTPEAMTAHLKAALPDQLKSVILYGSAASGDYDERHSDYNLLIVLEKLGLPELRRLSPLTRPWVAAGNPPPLCFTRERLLNSTDVFPLEMLDIQESHRLLHGEDIVKNLPISAANLRHQLEFELKSKLIQLRARYLALSGNPKEVLRLLVGSLSSFLALFRGVLRLYDPHPPAGKWDSLHLLADHLKLDTMAFTQLRRLKQTKAVAPEESPDAVFGAFLQTVQQVVDAVDRFRVSASEPTQE